MPANAFNHNSGILHPEDLPEGTFFEGVTKSYTHMIKHSPTGMDGANRIIHKIGYDDAGTEEFAQTGRV